MNQSENLENSGGTGYLTVRVSTAQNAIPIEGATVTITGREQQNSGVMGVLVTDRSGRTPRVPLPAPPKAESETPGYVGEPFYRYNILVEAEGYYPAELFGAAVFDSITSVQPVNLIPRAEYTPEPFGTQLYEDAPAPLEGGE